jgi:DNA polymerase III delta subunit
VTAAAPLAFFWGDDELATARALDAFQADLETTGGAPMDRWLIRGDRNAAAGIVATIHERVATPVLFGGGTFAVVANAGGLVVRNEDRDAFLGLLEVVAPGNGLAVVDASQSGAKAPSPKRLADAIAAAGGTVRQFKSPREGALAGWIENEARDRGLRLEPGASKALAERIGGFVREADAERGQQTRMASMELDKLGLYRGAEPIRVEDVRELVVEAVPSSVWAFTDAVAERRVDRALEGLDRLLETTPEPVLLAVLHRRVRELIETGDRLAAGERLPAVGRAMGINSEYRMERLRDQAKRWTTDELIAALDGLVELDAVVKGAPDRELDEAQRRLAFALWVIDHAGADRPGGA